MPDPGVQRVKRRRGYNAFGWSIFILLLMGGVMATWIACFYVYNHPEDADCYHFLQQIHKIDPPKRFELTAAPPGQFFSARELYDTYLTMSPQELEAKNDDLLRNYLRNYAQTKTPVPYIWGRFTTTGVYELSKSDIFPSGLVALADSADCPQVEIEHVYPTAFANVPRARQMLAIDPEIRLEKSFSLATLLHVDKLPDDRILFTVVPIDYSQYAYKQGISSTFRLDPPQALNLEAGFPVIKPDIMDRCVKNFALYRKNKGLLAATMLTLPPGAPSPALQADTSSGKNLPPEALQPYTPPVANDTNNNLADDNTTSTIPPADELPPVTTPSSAGSVAAAVQAVEAAHAAPQPVTPAAPVVTAVARPLAPGAPLTPAAPQVPAASAPATIAHVPVIPKTASPPVTAATNSVPALSATSTTSTMQAAAALVKQGKTNVATPPTVARVIATPSTVAPVVKPKPALAASTPQPTPRPVALAAATPP
ncbi:MAG TPA: hypothetical protein VG733_19565, partial [Chthoniobacteraceae bacterium]|nr:hypothetical protein [Chthoniobacteraceae bacterium]